MSEPKSLRLDVGILKADAANPRQIGTDAIVGLQVSMETFGDLSGIVWNERTGELVAGHQRMRGLREQGALTWTREGDRGWIEHPKTGERFSIRIVDWDDTTQRMANLTANNTEIQGDFTGVALEQLRALEQEANFEALRLDALTRELAGEDGDLGAAGEGGAGSGSLSDTFGVPPFSVLDARQGYWQDRKRAWLALGIRSEIGRGENSSPSDRPRPIVGPDGKIHRSDGHARAIFNAAPGGAPMPMDRKKNEGRLVYATSASEGEELDFASQAIVDASVSGTSVFDPVLCELAYRWFSPPDGAVLDPFAGGSVRGIVAAKLGRLYTGIDLSAVQVAANIAQAEKIVPAGMPRWFAGDSREVIPKLGVSPDLVFSCPPYADLEVYSDDPRDLSTMAYPEFLGVYREIIAQAIARLKPDRFACFVVGDIRGKDGIYRNFVSDTIAAFQDAGAKLYNEAILVTAIGSLSIRAGRQMQISRKLGKAHQNVLVFVKGDPRKATDACGKIELADPSTWFGETVEAPAETNDGAGLPD